MTAGGKNVAPAVLEDRLRAHPLVSQCIVVGDQQPVHRRLVTLDEEMLPPGSTTATTASVSRPHGRGDDPRRARRGAGRRRPTRTRRVSKAESIRKFAILETDFTEEHGHLTPKGSLRRKVVLKEFTERIEELYR